MCLTLSGSGLSTRRGRPTRTKYKSTLSLELPSDRMYELSGKPEPHGEEIDQSTDVMTVWAVFPNPHNVLVPGLKVHVISHLADQTP